MIDLPLVLLIVLICLVVARGRLAWVTATVAFAVGLIVADTTWGGPVSHFAMDVLGLVG